MIKKQQQNKLKIRKLVNYQTIFFIQLQDLKKNNKHIQINNQEKNKIEG